MSNLVLGDLGVILGLTSAAAAILALAAGLALRNGGLTHMGRVLIWGVPAGAATAFFAMERALITRDFSVEYVALNGSSRTAGLFNFATAWAALEGSILLWGLILGLYLAAMAWSVGRLSGKGAGRGSVSTWPAAREQDGRFTSWALICALVSAVFFFGLMVGPADPFRAFEAPAGYDGPGPNPLLQDNPLMIIHPPMLYLGYVGFTVPYAFATASLITGRTDEAWLARTRRWSLLAWGFLTAGIVLGAWWSYDTLGWGGYWAWDPVENVSFLPWLTATACLHSSLAEKRRGLLRVWNLSLISATFALTILGTFITRSGIIDSVHSFTTSGIGPSLLGFFGFVTVATVTLVGWRGDRLRSAERVNSIRSREGAFLANNLLLCLFALVVLLGTTFPLVVEALTGERRSVGSPYFSNMTMPIGLALLFLMAVAPTLRWGRSAKAPDASPEADTVAPAPATLPATTPAADTVAPAPATLPATTPKATTARETSRTFIPKRLETAAWTGALALALALALGARGLVPLLAFTLGGFAAGTALKHLLKAVRSGSWRGLTGSASGGMLTHLGIVIVAVALAASSSYLQQDEIQLAEGETRLFAGMNLTFLGTEEVRHPERVEVRARIATDGVCCATPGVSRYTLRGQVVGHPTTLSSPLRDVQLAVLRLPEETGETLVLKVVRQPLVVWLWAGGGVMLAGALLAALPAARRKLRGINKKANTGDCAGAENNPLKDPAASPEEAIHA